MFNNFFSDVLTSQAQYRELSNSNRAPLLNNGFYLTPDVFDDYISFCLAGNFVPLAAAANLDFGRFLPGGVDYWPSLEPENTPSRNAQDMMINEQIVGPIIEFLRPRYAAAGIQIPQYPIARTALLRWFKLHWDIWRMKQIAKADNYTGNRNTPELRFKIYARRVQVGLWMFGGAALFMLGTISLLGNLPGWAWFFAIGVFVFTLRMLWRVTIYINRSAIHHALQRNNGWYRFRSYRDSDTLRTGGRDASSPVAVENILSVVVKDSYLAHVYRVNLVEKTLRYFRFVDAAEAQGLLDALQTGQMPRLSDWRAEKILIMFFNKVSIYVEQGLACKFPDPAQLLPLYVSITAFKELLMVDRAQLDSVEIRDNKGDVTERRIVSIFESIKNIFSDDLRIYLNDYLESIGLPYARVEALVNELSHPAVRFDTTCQRIHQESGVAEQTISDHIYFNWVLFHSENTLKTVRTVYHAAYWAYHSYLWYVLGREPTPQEIERYLRFIFHYNGALDITLLSRSFGFIEGAQPWELNRRGSPRLVINSGQPSADLEHVRELRRFFVGKGRSMAYAASFMQPSELGKEDGAVWQMDWSMLAFPAFTFLLPFDVYEFSEDPDLGILLNDLLVGDEALTSTNREVSDGEDGWNVGGIPAKARSGVHNFYGVGMMRLRAYKDTLVITSAIEDTEQGNRILDLGYRAWHSARITMLRAREKTFGRLPSFLARFCGPVIAYSFSILGQKAWRSTRIHRTEKLDLLVGDFDYYFNKLDILPYNFMMYVFGFFFSFNFFGSLFAGLFFVVMQFILTQAITSASHSLNLDRYPFSKYYARAVKMYWSSVMTYLPIIPLHHSSGMHALEGRPGIFSRGGKTTEYVRSYSSELRGTFKFTITVGISLFIVELFTVFDPFAVAYQIFFFMIIFKEILIFL